MSNPNGSAVMADRDELARLLARMLVSHCHRWMVADAILASDWLARVRADEREAALGLAHECIVMEKDDPRNANSPDLRFGLGVALTIIRQMIVQKAAIRERNQ